MGSLILQTLQDPILPLPWVCFRGDGFPAFQGKKGGAHEVELLLLHDGARLLEREVVGLSIVDSLQRLCDTGPGLLGRRQAQPVLRAASRLASGPARRGRNEVGSLNLELKRGPTGSA
jgi:hypothetical protein